MITDRVTVMRGRDALLVSHESDENSDADAASQCNSSNESLLFSHSCKIIAFRLLLIGNCLRVPVVEK